MVFSGKYSSSTNIKPSAILEKSLQKICDRTLTDVQKRILLHICRNGHSNKTCSRYVREISREMGIPESTVKWSMNSLRDALLIEGGSAAVKGVPVRVTYPGLLVAEGLRGSEA